MKLTLMLALSCLLAIGTVGAEAKTRKPASTKAKKEATLFKRLGGKKAITAVVDEFVTNCATDTRINTFFEKTAADPKRLTTFKAHLVDQICSATGGGCKYKGKDMKTAHHGMGIKDEHFTALVEDLAKALDKFKVPEKEKGELLGALATMKPQIVETTM